MINLLVATDLGGGIGFRNQIPWHLPEEIRWFKRITLGNVIVMGRNTWQSLPKKPLPGRTNLVLSRNIHEKPYNKCGPWYFNCLQTALDRAREIVCNDIFIIGGREVFSYAIQMEVADKIYQTVVKNLYRCDTYFPSELIIEQDWNSIIIQDNDDYYIKQYSRAKKSNLI